MKRKQIDNEKNSPWFACVLPLVYLCLTSVFSPMSYLCFYLCLTCVVSVFSPMLTCVFCLVAHEGGCGEEEAARK